MFFLIYDGFLKSTATVIRIKQLFTLLKVLKELKTGDEIQEQTSKSYGSLLVGLSLHRRLCVISRKSVHFIHSQ